MGQNLSSKVVVDTTKDLISPEDAVNEKILLILWLCSAYAIAMIWSTVMLVDRWGGPHGGRKIGFGSVIAAILLSSAWPLVFVYLMMSG